MLTSRLGHKYINKEWLMFVVIGSSCYAPPEHVKIFIMAMVPFRQHLKPTVSLLHFIFICWLLNNACYLAQPVNVKSKRGGKGKGKNAVALDFDGVSPAYVDSDGKALIIISFRLLIICFSSNIKASTWSESPATKIWCSCYFYRYFDYHSYYHRCSHHCCFQPCHFYHLCFHCCCSCHHHSYHCHSCHCHSCHCHSGHSHTHRCCSCCCCFHHSHFCHCCFHCPCSHHHQPCWQ